MHGLHLLGGLVALAMTADKVWRGFAVNQVRSSVQLCAVYWHFLLALWLVLIQSADAVGGRLRRYLSPATDLGRTKSR